MRRGQGDGFTHNEERTGNDSTHTHTMRRGQGDGFTHRMRRGQGDGFTHNEEKTGGWFYTQ